MRSVLSRVLCSHSAVRFRVQNRACMRVRGPVFSEICRRFNLVDRGYGLALFSERRVGVLVQGDRGHPV